MALGNSLPFSVPHFPTYKIEMIVIHLLQGSCEELAPSFMESFQDPCLQELISLRNGKTNQTLTFVKHFYALSKSFIDHISAASYNNPGGQGPLPSLFCRLETEPWEVPQPS